MAVQESSSSSRREDRGHDDDERRRQRRRERRKRREAAEREGETDQREHRRDRDRGDNGRDRERSDRERHRDQDRHRDQNQNRDRHRDPDRNRDRDRDRDRRTARSSASANSSTKEEPAAAAPVVAAVVAADDDGDDDDDEYGDDFDSYEEEEFEMEEPAPSSPNVAGETASSTQDGYGTKSSTSSSTMRFPESKSSSSSRSSAKGRAGHFTVVHTTAPTKLVGAPENGASTWKPGPNPRRARRVQIHRSKVGALEAVSSRLLDLPPLGKMDMYVRRLGARSIKQVAQSTSDDVRSMEAQTDDISMDDKSAQVPDDLGYGSSSSNMVTASTSTENGSSSSSSRSGGTSVAAQARQAMGLTNFLRLAGGLVEAIVEENNMESAGRQQQHNSSSSKEGSDSAASPSSATTWMGTASGLEYLQDRPVVSISSAETTVLGTSKFIVTIHGPKGQSGRSSKRDQFTIERKDSSFVASLASKSLLCVWSIATSKSIQHPTKTMICEGVPQCCALSPGLGNIVVAGTEEGTLALWDLSEPANLHHIDDAVTLQIRNGLRRPTYTTDALTFRDGGAFMARSSTANNGTGKRNLRSGEGSSTNEFDGNQHHTPVVAARLLQEAGGRSFRNTGAGSTQDTNAMSFQLATLEEAGVVMLWTVLKLKRGDPAGSETDLGLGIGGRVKLVRSARINVLNNVAEEVTAMSFCSNDLSRFYVGTLSGRLLHESRFSTVLSPREYQAGEHTRSSSVCCMATTQHPAMGDYFLVGRADGSMSMYNAEESSPVAVWDDTSTGAGNEASGGLSGDNGPGDTKWSSVPHRIVKIVWATWRPSLFWVLDSGGRLHRWDLLINAFGPIGQVDQMNRDRRAGEGDLPALLDVVLCRERSRASLVALCANGEIAVRTLEGAQMREASDEDITHLRTALSELEGFVM